MSFYADLPLAYPELILAIGALLMLVFGDLVNPKLAAITDLDWREVAIFAPLCAGTLALGVYPMSVFHITQASVDQLVAAYHMAIGG